LIPCLRYTTGVLLGYCRDDLLSTLLPFLWDCCDPARNADFQNMPTRSVLVSGREHPMSYKSA